MLFFELVELKLETELGPYIDKLLKMKMGMNEMGLAPRIDHLNEYIERSMTGLKSIADEMPEKKNEWGL